METGTENENDVKKDIKSNNHIKVFLGIAIPVIVVLYIVLSNLAPFGAVHDYTIDVGGSDQAGDAKLTGPFDRVSDKLLDNTDYQKTGKIVNYRELTSGLVYFDVTDPLLNDNNAVVNVSVAFKNNFPEGQKFILGAQNSTGFNFSWHDIYNPLYEAAFASGKPVYSADNLSSASLGEKVGLIDANIGSLIYNYPENYQKLGKANDFNISIRGSHVLYAYIKDEPLNLTLTKQDNNYYNGSDSVDVNVYAEDGTLVAKVTLPDDGISNKTDKARNLIMKNVYASGLKNGVYRIEIKSNSFGDDFSITRIQTPLRKLVFADRIFIISPSALYTEYAGAARMQTWHTESFQNVTAGSIVMVNATGKWFDININSTKIGLPNGDMIIEIPFISFTQDSYFKPLKYKTVKITNASQIANVDAIVVGNDYTLVEKNGSWTIGSTSWMVSDVYVKDSRLGFVMNVPHLGKAQYKNYTIPVDWIKININK